MTPAPLSPTLGLALDDLGRGAGTDPELMVAALERLAARLRDAAGPYRAPCLDLARKLDWAREDYAFWADQPELDLADPEPSALGRVA